MNEDRLEYVKKVLSLLDNDKLKKELNKLYIEAIEDSDETYEFCRDEFSESNPDEEFPDDKYDYREGAISSAIKGPAKEIFDKYVISKLETPKIITADDLAQALYSHYEILNHDETVFEFYQIYLDNFLGDVLSKRETEPFRIGFIADFVLILDKNWHKKLSEKEPDEYKILNNNLWSKNGISINILINSESNSFFHDCYYAEIVGESGKNGFEKLCKEMIAVLHSIFVSISSFEKGEGIDYLPAMGKNYFENNHDFIKTCLDYFYISPVKNSLDQRIRNAIHLLVLADNQEEPLITSALSFPAIEALTCKKEGIGVTDELSRNVTALLEPDKMERVDMIKKIKELYDKRSRILHGDTINNEPEFTSGIRRLAAVCLKAIFEWRKNQIMNKGKDKKDEKKEYFKELNAAVFQAQKMVGVTGNSMGWLSKLDPKK